MRQRSAAAIHSGASHGGRRCTLRPETSSQRGDSCTALQAARYTRHGSDATSVSVRLHDYCRACRGLSVQ